MFRPVCLNCGVEMPESFSFCGHCGRSLDEPLPLQTLSPPSAGERVTVLKGERRDVTVLFADVMGFTAICERLDPEAVRAVMNECFEGLGGAIHKEEGYIDKYMGDNVMALFGAPVSHEDDPARACRAALAMRTFLVGFAERCWRQSGAILRMRIGINAGLVVAGGVGSDVRMDYSVMGDTVNLAARLETAAPADGILVSREIVRRTGGQFEFGVARYLTVKGKDQPVEAYELLRKREESERRLLERRSIPLIGRETELRELISLWETAAPADRWIAVRGETGLGKTKLVKEAEKRIVGKRLLTVEVTSETGRRPFGLIRLLVYAILENICEQSTRPESRQVFVESLSVFGDDLIPFRDVLWHLVAPSRLAVPASDPDPQTLRQTLERGVVKLLESIALFSPNLAWFIDSYGLADDASANLLESLGARPEGWPMPILVAARYGGRAPIDTEKTIRLRPLSDDEMNELLNQFVKDADLPERLRCELVQRAAGVPLYLGEMVGSLIDQGVLTATPAGLYQVSTDKFVSISLPSSIRAAVVARLDQLSKEARGLLCECSVQGVEFTVDMTEHVRHLNGLTSSALPLFSELERRGLVMALDRRERWAFRHPLMQETCYETLLLEDRRRLHTQTAQALEEVAGGLHAVSPELLAYHYEHAEEWAGAAEANLRAGDRAADLFLNQEALKWYEQALSAFERLKAPSANDLRVATSSYGGAARIHMRIGAYPFALERARKMRSKAMRCGDRAEADRLTALAHFHTGCTEDAERLLLEAMSEAQDPAARQTRMWALYDLADLYHRAGRTREALDRVQECREAGDGGDDLVTVRADMLEGKIYHAAGRFADAMQRYARAYEIAERVGSLSDRARASNNLGNAARDLGRYAEAHEHFERALTLWDQTGDVECMAGARNNLGNLAMSQGHFIAARGHHQKSLSLCSRIANIQGASLAQANLAVLAMEEGNALEAVRAAKEALITLGDSAQVLLRGLVRVILGEGRLESGEIQEAQAQFDLVLKEVDESLHPLAVAGALRGLGRVALLNGAYVDALALLTRATEIFERLKREQESARTGLYRAEALWRSGDTERGRIELERVRRRFGLMQAARDAARADQLLKEMRNA